MKRFLLFLTAFVFATNLFAFEYKGDNFKVIIATTIPVETSLSYGKTEKAYKVWIDAIKNAKKTIDFSEFYLTGKDKWPLSLVVNEIVNAAKRGVKIRFLVDVKMLKNSLTLINYFQKIQGIKITLFNWSLLTGGINHSKYFIVDNKICYIGSQNFDWRALKHIHETGILTDEPHIVKALSLIFNADWDYNNGDREAYKKLRKKHLTFLQNFYLVASPPQCIPSGVKFSLSELVNLIHTAKKSITIQLLNYSTYIHSSTERFETITDALIKAAKRNVKIRILVSDWNLKKPEINSIKQLAEVKNIEVKIVHIPQSKEGFIPYSRVIHSKVMTIDDNTAWIGTSNFGYDYFFKSRNVEVVIKIKPIVRELKKLFEDLWNSPYSFTFKPKKDYKSPKIA